MATHGDQAIWYLLRNREVRRNRLSCSTRTHEGRFPVVVSFDPGNGGEPSQVALPSGSYMIGVNPETGLWDLFLAAETE